MHGKVGMGHIRERERLSKVQLVVYSGLKALAAGLSQSPARHVRGPARLLLLH